MKTLTVHVTKTGIKRGEREDACNCPIARALRRAGLKNPTIDGTFIEYGWSTQFRVRTPARARQFIRRFDARKPVEPFTFRLKLPDDGRGAGR